MVSEENVIGYLKAQFSDSASIIGIEEDIAVFSKNGQEYYIITKDLLVEDQHFTLTYYDSAFLADQALQVTLNDIAAMGAKSSRLLLGLALSLTLPEKWLKVFLKSFTEACKENGDEIVSSQEVREVCAAIAMDPLQCMLVGGEDYDLLVTINLQQYELFAITFLKQFGYPLIHVGNITQQSGVRLIQNNQEFPIEYQPFSHLGELS